MFRIDTDWEKLRLPVVMRTISLTVTTNPLERWNDNGDFYTMKIDVPLSDKDRCAITNHDIWQLYHVADDDTYPQWQKGGDPVGREEKEDPHQKGEPG